MKMNNPDLDLNDVLKKVMAVAEKVGKNLIKHQKKLEDLKITSKEAQGVVSNADMEAEKVILQSLSKLYPQIPFLAEEDAYKRFKGKSEAYEHFKGLPAVWVIDPLDGTTNYLNGLNYYGVCISLVSFGKPVLGVVHRPSSEEFYYAIMGNGAFLKKGNKKEQLFSHKNSKKLKDSLFVTGFATEKGEVFEKEFSMFKHIMGNSRGVRRMGSAAIDLCYVARGLFDGFWERGLAPWDTAAAGLICQEAGVRVTNYEGRVFSPFDSTILAARAPLYKKLDTQLKEAP
jgi:myo-inositol-1(or 4)-monophosphatase